MVSPKSLAPLLVTAGLLLSFDRLPAQEQTTVGGYGEIHYANASGAGTPAEVNVARFVVYLAHTFSDRLVFRSELELEDTKLEAGGTRGEIGLEQVYVDFRLSERLTLRTGLVLPPVGIINETHEPPTFNGVARPGFDHDMIPTTWREIGVGALGTLPVEGLSYRIYLVNGLRADGFSGSTLIREGRQEGQEASFANPSVTGRLEWARPGLKIGAAFWYGGSANADPALGTGRFANAVSLFAADARFQQGPVSARAVLATVGIAGAGAIDSAYGTDVGSRATGGYVEGAYNVLAQLAPGTTQRLDAFARYERYNTQAAVPAGTVRDLANARRIATLGLAYRPVNNVVFKGDFQLQHNGARFGERNVLSLGVGYAF